ncbi:hypothetical protein B0T16DRAFT_515492 [Cercophora newfieldiana]|uniref:Uncharacterized protein n=1 Tax=Cercophora newfieldiana TaxID=92897 RepID=A0AA39XXB4_9PEZI|nr:hypothetical protein B0T16DRAFT_515492 [Cercophora newfieldiana]
MSRTQANWEQRGEEDPHNITYEGELSPCLDFGVLPRCCFKSTDDSESSISVTATFGNPEDVVLPREPRGEVLTESTNKMFRSQFGEKRPLGHVYFVYEAGASHMPPIFPDLPLSETPTFQLKLEVAYARDGILENAQRATITCPIAVLWESPSLRGITPTDTSLTDWLQKEGGCTTWNPGEPIPGRTEPPQSPGAQLPPGRSLAGFLKRAELAAPLKSSSDDGSNASSESDSN